MRLDRLEDKNTEFMERERERESEIEQLCLNV